MNTTGRAVDDISSFFVSVDSLILVLFGCALISVTTGYKLMDYFIHNAPLDTSKIEREKLIHDYETAFVDELEALDNIVLTKEEMKNLMLLKHDAETPFGKVIMTYDVDAVSFCYYTDSSVVPYKTLDSVARQFAVAHNCKSICVNYKEEWKKAKAAAKLQEEEELAKNIADKVKKNDDETPNESKEHNVFAKFKSYNTVNKESNVTIDNAKPNKNRKDSIKRRKYRYDDKKSNRFTHKGRLYEYKLIDNTKGSAGSNKLSFAEFKRLELGLGLELEKKTN